MPGLTSSLSLPFETGTCGRDFFSTFTMKYPPYAHQDKAFNNLTGPALRSTLVATGTGSGKTECFLYPILHHCREEAPRSGIKAILIYPMNALATDQAGRIAELIDNAPNLKDRISAGLYVGSKEASPTTTMGAMHVITCKETLRRNPSPGRRTLGAQRSGDIEIPGGGRAAHL